jgi:DNA-binding PadR family transcriptional regulator
VSPRSEFSPQTLSVLAALSDRPSEWHHGYEVARVTGLKSGTLYPILIRLADWGLLEAEWQDEPAPGRPRRHLYRLTAPGLAAAGAARAGAPARPERTRERRAPKGALRPVVGNS